MGEPGHASTVRSATAGAAGPFDLGDDEAYRRWRDAKLAAYPATVEDLMVEIGDLAHPTAVEKERVRSNCRRANMAIHVSHPRGDDAGRIRGSLRSFAAAFGLGGLETHRSAGEDGVVALEVARHGSRGGYIPYTDRPLNWHTDGYYNAVGASIRSFVLHCVRAAAQGGENGLLDPEIAYIRLRDEDPDLAAALMRPGAMTIPANVEANGNVRPESVGPVFFVDPMTSALQMRYTARKRNIVWHDDEETHAAADFLIKLLDGGEPLVFRYKLVPGQGVICNNVLHSRAGFTNGPGAENGRLHLRARYSTRIAAT